MTIPDPGPIPGEATFTDLGVITDEVAHLRLALPEWQGRREPDADARRSASCAITAIDRIIAAAHRIRAGLIAETRAADDATAARVDTLLAARKAEAEEHPE